MALTLFLIAFIIVLLALLLLFIVSARKVLKKAGKPGWAALIPFYNGWSFAEVGGRPGWWGLIAFLGYYHNSNLKSGIVLEILGLIYLVGFVFYILISLGIAKNFGKSNWFAVALMLFPFIAYPVLAYGPAKYKPVVSVKKKNKGKKNGVKKSKKK